MLRWVLVVVAVAVAVVIAAMIGIALFTDVGEDSTTAEGDGDFTHIYQLDGDFEDARGGPSLEATGGEFGPEGFVFEPGDGLTADIALGDSYTIEFRVRVDRSEHAFKLLDFRDGSSDGGLYVFEESDLLFWFSNGCGTLGDEAQGCPLPTERHPMAVRPFRFVPGEWFTVSFSRDGDTNALSAVVDGVPQAWEIMYPPWDVPEGFVPRQVDHADDFMDEAVQPLTNTPLRVVQDDRVTTTETGSGELAYLKITVQSRR